MRRTSVKPVPSVEISRPNVPEPLVFVAADVIDIDSYPFIIDDEPPKPKRERKPNKAKLLRSAQKKSAKVLLSEMLANGDVRTSEIDKAANKAGIPHEALRRAKGSLKVRSFVTESGSVWRLPPYNSPSET